MGQLCATWLVWECSPSRPSPRITMDYHYFLRCSCRHGNAWSILGEPENTTDIHTRSQLSTLSAARPVLLMLSLAAFVNLAPEQVAITMTAFHCQTWKCTAPPLERGNSLFYGVCDATIFDGYPFLLKPKGCHTIWGFRVL